MDVTKSITYIFQDKRWFTKLLIGWLVSLVPILNFAFTGYSTETIKNVENKREFPLPEWDDFGKKFVLGFYMWIAGLVYALPILILTSLFIIPILFTSNGDMGDAAGAIIGGSALVYTCIVGLYGLALTLFLPALNINLARKGTLGSCFALSEIIRIFSRNSGDYLLSWLMTVVWAVAILTAVSIITPFLILIPCIGWIAAFMLGGLAGVAIPLVYAHLFGQVAAREIERVE